MDPSYFAAALEDLSETLKPFVGEDVAETLDKLVSKLQIEYPNLAIQRYSILDEKSKPHCVAFDFELDLILYLHSSCNFDSLECLREIKDIVLTWNISDLEDIHGGFQCLFQGVTVNLLLARDMVLLERRQPRSLSHTEWFQLEQSATPEIPRVPDYTIAEEEAEWREADAEVGDPAAVNKAHEFEDDEFVKDVLKLAQQTKDLCSSGDDIMSGGSEVIFGDQTRDSDSDSDVPDNVPDNETVYSTESKGQIHELSCEQNILEEIDNSPEQLNKRQCENVMKHIEEQTSAMTDTTDRFFVIQNLGKRYSSSLAECYHDFFATQSTFCVSFIRVCKFWCLKVFLNNVHFGLLRYVEALGVYVCSRKQHSSDFHVIFLDFLLALKKFNSIKIDFGYYIRGNYVGKKFKPPYIADVSFPYSNILDDIAPSDFERLADASEEFLKSMKAARCFRTDLFSVSPYPAWLTERFELFYFVFQPSDNMSIQISVQSNKKDLVPDDFLPGLSSRLYLWRQCAIADTRKHQARESGGFHRAVSGLVIIEFVRAMDAREVIVTESVVQAARHKIVISFPDFSHEAQVFRSRPRNKSLFSSLLCGGCSTSREDEFSEFDVTESDQFAVPSSFRTLDSSARSSRYSDYY